MDHLLEWKHDDRARRLASCDELVRGGSFPKRKSFGHAARYHTPRDVILPDWDLAGLREDLKVYFAVGYRIAQADKIPEWKPGNEFKAKRDEMLAGR